MDKDIPEKKRRKTSNTAAGGDTSALKSQKEDIYENVITHEEQEALKRAPEKDMALFHHTCQELKKLFEEVAALKKDNSEKAKSEIQEKRAQGSLIFVLLKKLNRLDKVRIRSGRDALHKEKLRVDSNRLQLQNLLYESNHLKREVQRCYQFKSQDEEIDLVSEEEFYKMAPEVISQPEETKSNEHKRRMARLLWEIDQRKHLSKLCTELKVEKELASKDILLKTNRLNSLAPCLDELLKATKPLQLSLDMMIENDWEIQKSARLLPCPLYLLYANLSAYSDACMKSKLIVLIEGDEEEAKQLMQLNEKNEEKGHHHQQQQQQQHHHIGNDDDDMQQENQQESDIEEIELDGIERKKHHHKRLSTKSQQLTDDLPQQDDKLKTLFKPHPLSVVFKMSDPKTNDSISVSLHYLPLLDFITVKPIVSSVQSSGIAAGRVISSENILNSLYPNDFGDITPNPKTKYQLKNYGITEDKLIQMIIENNLGKPYKWAQKLCGLEFIEIPVHHHYQQQDNQQQQLLTTVVASASTKISHELAQDSVTSIIKAIKLRWQFRLGLFKQILALENKNVDILPNPIIDFDGVDSDGDDDDDIDEEDGEGEDDEYNRRNGVTESSSKHHYNETSISRCSGNMSSVTSVTVASPPIRISCNLVQWTLITWNEYSTNPTLSITQRFIDENLINHNDLFYKAIIIRGIAKLECYVCISSNFPIQSPIWALNLCWNGKHDALNNTAIKDIEYWVNSLDITSKSMKKQKSLLSRTSILSIQLKRVMSCLDIFLETEGPLYSPAEFTQDKIFLKPFRGRQRSRPYKIVQNGESIIFKQI